MYLFKYGVLINQTEQIKKLKFMKAITILFFLAIGLNCQAQVAVNSTGSQADNSAMLDVSSTSKGFLVPRMNEAQRATISSPATGLMFYQTSGIPGFYYNSGTPASPSWTYISTGFNWSINGNSGTTESANFIGTTDYVPLTFKVFGQQSGKIDHTLFNTSLGFLALGNNSTGTSNSAFGFYAMQNNTTGCGNTAMGHGALITQSYNPGSVWFSENVALGFFALYYNQPTAVTNGIFNTSTGAYSLFKNTIGSNNTANGHYALYNNTSGYSNVAVGSKALYRNTMKNNLVAIGDSALYNNGQNVTIEFQATCNTAVGSKSLYANTNGYGNSANGYRSLYFNTTGYRNSGFGAYSLYSNTLGSDNTAIGSYTLVSNSTGKSNVAVGTNALQSQSYNPGYVWNSDNIAIGFEALFNNQPTSTSNGIKNIAIGSDALHGNTTGYKNAAMGYRALYSNTLGVGNIAIGDEALYFNTQAGYNIAAGMGALYSNVMSSQNIAIGVDALASQGYNPGYVWVGNNVALGNEALFNNFSSAISNGINNTALGNSAMHENQTGYWNTSVGYTSLYYNSTGFSNTAMGYQAMVSSETGWQNTAVGANSMYYTVIGSYNTAIGYNTGPASTGYNYYNTTCLGIDATATGNDMVRIGNGYVSSIGGFQNWTNVSDGRFKENVREDVPGLSFISQLRPVTYQLDRDRVNEFTGVYDRREKIRAQDPNAQFQTGERLSPVTTGFIAQEVEIAARNCGFTFSGVDAPKNESDLYGLRYAEFVVPLVKAVQEQQQQIEQLKAENAALEARLAEVEEKLAK
jgi:trimeric autotransporter adhesin